MTNNTIVVVDSDFHILADDHEALAMLAPAHRAGKLKIAGVTVVTGNTWTHVSEQHARYALENLGFGDSVPVHPGGYATAVTSAEGLCTSISHLRRRIWRRLGEVNLVAG